MTWLLTLTFGGESEDMALATLDEVFDEISEALAIPLNVDDNSAKHAMFQHEHAIDIEAIAPGSLRRLPVNLAKAWDARGSQHARLALEADISARAAG
jgi:hypothetical protein